MRVSKKRQQLIEKGTELFLKHGVKRITIEEICVKAEVSKMTYYKYFTNKEALLKTIRDDLMEQGFSKFDEINTMDVTFVEKVGLMSKWRMEFFSTIQSEFLDEIIEMDDYKKAYMTRYIDNIKTAQQRGEIRKDLSPDLVALMTEKMREMTLEESWRGIFDDYATYQQQLRTIMFFGMLSDENRH